jgi:hypothetical protein
VSWRLNDAEIDSLETVAVFVEVDLHDPVIPPHYAIGSANLSL